jgi:hypothetical protein
MFIATPAAQLAADLTSTTTGIPSVLTTLLPVAVVFIGISVLFRLAGKVGAHR